MMSEFKKEAEAVEKNLFALLAELDKVAKDQVEWTRPVYVPIDVDAAKVKIIAELKKEAAAMNGSFKGALKSVFRRVDLPVGSTGDQPCQK